MFRIEKRLDTMNKETETYTIGQVAEMFGISISSIRYYDREGLFPYLGRESGIRKFTSRDIEALRVIECLKKSGLEIRDIRHFMGLCSEGSSTYPERLELIEKQKAKVEDEMKKLEKTLDMLKYKCWYYTTSIRDGSEDNAKAMTPDLLPEDVRNAWENSHS